MTLTWTRTTERPLINNIPIEGHTLLSVNKPVSAIHVEVISDYTVAYMVTGTTTVDKVWIWDFRFEVQLQSCYYHLDHISSMKAYMFVGNMNIHRKLCYFGSVYSIGLPLCFSSHGFYCGYSITPSIISSSSMKPTNRLIVLHLQ